MRFRRYLPLGILAAFVALIQIAVSAAGSEYFLTQFTMSAYYSLVIIGLTVLMGYTGQISMGHAAFFAMGGYVSAVLTAGRISSGSFVAGLLVKTGLATSTAEGQLVVCSWAAFTAAMAITATVAVCIGTPILKLKGHYLAMATLGFGTIIYRIALGTPLFGEADGISNVPAFNLFAGISISGDNANRVQNYYIAWVTVITGMALLLNLVDSRTGRALRAIHGSEEAAKAMGVNTSRYKVVIFVISALFAATGGVFLTHFNGGIGPTEAGVMKSVRYLAIVAIGGMANLWGALFMGIILNYLSLRGVFGSYDDVVFGLILILIMLFSPDGILSVPNRERLKALFLRKGSRTGGTGGHHGIS